jgi:hypothetical protein
MKLLQYLDFRGFARRNSKGVVKLEYLKDIGVHSISFLELIDYHYAGMIVVEINIIINKRWRLEENYINIFAVL